MSLLDGIIQQDTERRFLTKAQRRAVVSSHNALEAHAAEVERLTRERGNYQQAWTDAVKLSLSIARERDEARAQADGLRQAAQRVLHLDTFAPPPDALPTDEVYRQWDADWEAAVSDLAALAALPKEDDRE